MELSVITRKEEIDAAQRLLESRLRDEATQMTRHIPIAGQVKAQTPIVWYVRRLRMWFASKQMPNRWWNAFGFGDPEAARSLSIIAHINPSFDGSHISAGAFLKGTDDEIWLGHDGGAGGAKKGVSKKAILDASSGSVQTVDGYDYVVIGRIGAKDFLDKLASFVHTIESFKAASGREGTEASDEGEEDDAEEDYGESGEVTDEPWRLDDFLKDTDAATRHSLLKWLGTAIRHVHAQNASCWAITGRKGHRLRLLVGNAVAFEISRDGIGVGLHLPSIPESADAVADGGNEDFQYARPDGGVTRWFSIDG